MLSSGEEERVAFSSRRTLVLVLLQTLLHVMWVDCHNLNGSNTDVSVVCVRGPAINWFVCAPTRVSPVVDWGGRSVKRWSTWPGLGWSTFAPRLPARRGLATWVRLPCMVSTLQPAVQGLCLSEQHGTPPSKAHLPLATRDHATLPGYHQGHHGLADDETGGIDMTGQQQLEFCYAMPSMLNNCRFMRLSNTETQWH